MEIGLIIFGLLAIGISAYIYGYMTGYEEGKLNK
jgi:hypothetical protein